MRPCPLRNRLKATESLFLTVSLEIRRQIYQNLLVSQLSQNLRQSLYRPLGIDDDVFRIGYFQRDTVIPLLLVNHQVHDEAVEVLYHENVFAFYVSGLHSGSLAFLEKLPMKYLELLRQVYVRTGFGALTSQPVVGSENAVSYEGFTVLSRRRCPCVLDQFKSYKPFQSSSGIEKDLALDLLTSWTQQSAFLLQEALPWHFDATVNSEDTIKMQAECDTCDWKKETSSYFPRLPAVDFFFTPFWKLVWVAADGESPHQEFRRIQWCRDIEDDCHPEEGFDMVAGRQPMQ